jgi:hypothetical protein
MSLYRQPRAARPLLLVGIAVAALLVGGAIGFALGRGSAPEPSAQDVVAQLRDELRPLAAGLELLPTEYPQALAGGGESAAVSGDLDRIRSALADATPDLRTLDPAGARTLADRVAALEQAVHARAPAAQVERLTAAAQAALASVPGGS